MPGTGLYYTKAAPAHNDDTQSGAPAGQVITLVTGGLGVADAWKGGYVTNATRSETRAIVSHTDDTVTLEGDLSAWLDTDDLDIYDAWATIQGALDQLWTDQSTATFTASQYIRVFAGTYDENVVPNAGLVPDVTNGYLLVVEGDPADNRENIKLDPAAGVAINASCDQIRVRHMWIDVTSNSNCLYTTGTCFITEVLDCKLTGVASAGTVRAANGAHIEDCEMTLSGDGRAYYSANSACIIKSCKMIGPGKAGSAKAALRVDKNYGIPSTIVEGSVISGFEYGVEIADNAANGVRLLNTTFHDCTAVIKSVKATCSPQEVVNCIFKDCTYNFWVPTWPEETATRTGPAFIQRNNCYHGYTSFAYNGAAAKTYAEWIAYAQVDDDGELDATDPLLTNPGAGDFSLESGSPCRHTGHGSGVTTDYLGTAYDPNDPDIGAWSSGVVSDDPVGTPSITSATDKQDGDGVTLTLVADNAGDVLSAYYKLETASAWTLFGSTRTGSGDLDVTGLEERSTYDFLVQATRGGKRSVPSNIATATVTTGMSRNSFKHGATVLTFPGPEFGNMAPVEIYQARGRTADGLPLVTDKGVRVNRFELRWTELSTSKKDEFVAFFDSGHVNGSANVFDYCDHSDDEYTVRLLSDAIQPVEQFEDIWGLELALEEDQGS